MIKLADIYDYYYKYTDVQRQSSLWSWFTEGGGRENTLYYSIALTDLGTRQNYNCRHGLIRVSQILLYKHSKWFRVSAQSPDDLDNDLDFEITHIRRDVIRYIGSLPKAPTTYRSVLINIQAKFGGKLYA